LKRSLLDSRRVRQWLRDQGVVVDGPADRRHVALTFDDGPHPDATPRLLEVLARHGVTATFFPLGFRAAEFPAVLAEVAAAGHEIGTHGYQHVPWVLSPPSVLRRDLSRSVDTIADACGVRPKVARPPFGWVHAGSVGICAELELEVVLGDVYPRDTTRPGTGTIVGRTQRRVGPGSIIILHDGAWRLGADRTQTLAAVDALIPRLRAEGYTFVTVERLRNPT